MGQKPVVVGAVFDGRVWGLPAQDVGAFGGDEVSRAIIAASCFTGICAAVSGMGGNSGKLSRLIPAMRVRDRPQLKDAQ